MKRRLIIAALPFLVLLASCHAPLTVTTPQGKTAYTADQVVQRLGEFQNAAIQANSTGGLDTPTTKLIVQYVVATTQTLKATPAGYIKTVQAGWTAFLPTLPASVTGNLNYQILIAAVTTAIAGLQ